MNDFNFYTKIKATVQEILPNSSILLYGSRARDDYHKDSDYDLLIVSDTPFSKKEKLDYESKIDKALVWALDKPFDIILSTKKEFEKYKDSKGHIIYYALKNARSL